MQHIGRRKLLKAHQEVEIGERIEKAQRDLSAALGDIPSAIQTLIALADETRRHEQRDQAEAKAAAFYNLIKQKDYARVVDGYNEIQKESLSKAEAEFFRDTEDRYRLELSVQAYQTGLNLMNAGRYAEAAESLRESLRYKEEASHMPAVKLNLAKALRSLGRPAEAQTLAKAVTEQSIDKDLQDDAAWLLSQCAEDMGQIDDARNELRALIRKWPRSSLVPDAFKKISELNLRAWKKRNDAPSGNGATVAKANTL